MAGVTVLPTALGAKEDGACRKETKDCLSTYGRSMKESNKARTNNVPETGPWAREKVCRHYLRRRKNLQHQQWYYQNRHKQFDLPCLPRHKVLEGIYHPMVRIPKMESGRPPPYALTRHLEPHNMNRHSGVSQIRLTFSFLYHTIQLYQIHRDPIQVQKGMKR